MNPNEKKKLENNNFNKIDIFKYESNNKIYVIHRTFFTIMFPLTTEIMSPNFKIKLLKEFNDVLNIIFKCKHDCCICKMIIDKQNILKVTNIFPDTNEFIYIDI